MRTHARLAVVSAILGGGLLLAGPVAAVEVDCDEYPDLAECQIDEDLGGNDGGAAEGEDDEDTTAGGGSQGSTGDAASLPFTGGEVTLIALAGTAALGGGIVLTAAGRKRKTV